MKNRLGFPPRKRHILEEVLDEHGKPTDKYICITCEKERK